MVRRGRRRIFGRIQRRDRIQERTVWSRFGTEDSVPLVLLRGRLGRSRRGRIVMNMIIIIMVVVCRIRCIVYIAIAIAIGIESGCGRHGSSGCWIDICVGDGRSLGGGGG